MILISALGKRFSVRLLCRSIIQKFDEGDIITKEYISQTTAITCGSSKNIEDAIDHFITSMNRNWANLHATPSGYRLLEINSLTLMTTFVPDLRGGCGEYLNQMHKSSERRGLLAIKSSYYTEEFEDNQMCLKDAVLFQVYGKEIMKKLISKYKSECASPHHDVGCYCYTKAEKDFLKLAEDKEYWVQFYEDKRINWEGIKFPAGLEDISKFSDQNPKIHIRAHLIYGASAVTVFVGERKKEQIHFVDVCFSEFHSFDTHEIKGHWYPVKNLCEFSSKILMKKERSDNVHKRYDEETCEKCMQHFHLPKKEDHYYDYQSSDPWDKSRGFVKYRNKYCPYEIPKDMHLTFPHREHMKICGMENENMFRAENSPSMITTPKSDFFLFSKYGQTVNDRFSGFFDLETFNQPMEPVCIGCELIINSCSNQAEKNKIYEKCIKEHFFRQNYFKCQACFSQFRIALTARKCDCQVEDEEKDKVLGNCLNCFIEEEKKFSDCNHQTTQNIKKLEASGYCFILFDNYRKQIAMTKIYFQESEKDVDPLKHFMKYLQEEVTDYVQKELAKVAPMVITSSQEEAFQQAQTCYTCHKPFRTNDKNRDHCHVLGTYRGAACNSCNRVLIIRNEVSIWAHNLTGK